MSSPEAAARPLTIAFRVGSFPKLSETFILKQISGLIALGHRVIVVADRPSDEAAPPSGIARLEYVEPTSSWLRSLYGRLPYRLRQARVARAEKRMSRQSNVVVCNFGWFGQQVHDNTSALEDPASIVTIFHGADMSRTLNTDDSRGRYETLLKSDGPLLPISDHWRQELLVLGARDSQITIYHMGVDPDEFAFRQRQDDPSGPFRIISVGRLVEKKGTEFALRALAKAAPQLGDRSFQLDLIGDGPLTANLKVLVAQLGLENSVVFHGSLPHADVANALSRADAFLLPSVTAADGDKEGIPVSLMEAMASGLPVISTRHSGIPELIEHGVSGWLADERDVDGLAEQIVALIQEPDARARRASAARQTIERDFNLNTLSEQLSDICRAEASIRGTAK